MTSYLWPSSPLATMIVLVLLHCLPTGYLGLVGKFYILTYLLFMLIGYIFSSRRQSRLVATPSSFVLVTGASSGIGAQLCRQFARNRFNLIMVARTQTKLDRLADEIRQYDDRIVIHVIVQDLAEPDAVSKLINKIETFQGINIDIIVNNAGSGWTEPFLETSSTNDTFERMMALHVHVPTLLMRHYLPKMFNRPSRIVNISSEISYISSPRAAVYASTKAYLTQLTTSVDYELEQIDQNKNVSLLLVTPGPTLNTEFNHHEDSIIFRFPFVTLTAEHVARDIVNACLRGDRLCIPGWANQLTVWIMTKVPQSSAHTICWLLWASWPQVKQWLHERRHLVIVCFNLFFFLLTLACYLLIRVIRHLFNGFLHF